MSDYKTYIEGDRVKFSISMQTFTIDYKPCDDDEIESEEALEWMRHKLEKALHNLSRGESK
jgi:hypothetical protein